MLENSDRNNNIKNDLTNKIIKYKNENTSLKKEIELLKNDSVKVKNLQIELDKKNKEINDLRNIISISIVSIDRSLFEIIKCYKTDCFSTFEDKFYQKYEKYLETENYFILNGNLIKKHLTINENNIKDRDKILFCFCENLNK